MGSYDLEFFSRNKSDHQDAGYRMVGLDINLDSLNNMGDLPSLAPPPLSSISHLQAVRDLWQLVYEL